MTVCHILHLRAPKALTAVSKLPQSSEITFYNRIINEKKFCRLSANIIEGFFLFECSLHQSLFR